MRPAKAAARIGSRRAAAAASALVQKVESKAEASSATAKGNKPTFDYGQVADDYAKYRKQFPDSFFTDLQKRGLIAPEKVILDLGSGTGMIPRKIAQMESKCKITALDCAQGMLDTAAKQDKELGITNVTYHCSSAEKTGLPDDHFDLIIAARCWHWFNQDTTIQEIMRISKPGATLIIAHFDPELVEGNPLDLVTKLIQKQNYDPTWKLPIKPGFEREFAYIDQLMKKNFDGLELHAFIQQEFVPQSEWVGFFNTTTGIGGNSKLSEVQKRSLNDEHAIKLREKFGDNKLNIKYILSSILSTVPAKKPAEKQPSVTEQSQQYRL